MTKEEIIDMARQAGFVDYELDDGTTHAFDKRYEAFARLVAKHTLMNIDPSKFISCQEVMEAARLAEREACAKVCEEYAIGLERNYSEIIADKIRARGEA